jgi:hypothetical protein
MPHVVINKYHSRVSAEGKVEVFEVGDPIEPTEEELAAFPDRFREADQARMRRGRPPGTPEKPEDTGTLLPPHGAEVHADKK